MQSSHIAPFWCKRLVVLRCVQVEQHREQGTKVHAVTGFLSAEHCFCKVGPHIAKGLNIMVLNENNFKLMNLISLERQ